MTQQPTRENNGAARREEEGARPCPPLTDPNEVRAIAQDFTLHVQNVISPALEAELPRIHKTRHFQDEEGRIHVEVMSPAWGLPSSLSLTIGPDGYAETRRLGYVDQDFKFHSYEVYRHDITDHVWNLMFNRMVRELGARKTAIITASERSNALQHWMYTEASRLVARLTVPMPDTDLPVPQENQTTQKYKQPDSTKAAATHLMYRMLEHPERPPGSPQLSRTAREHNRRMGLEECREEQPAGTGTGQPDEDPNAFNERVMAEAVRQAGAEAPRWTPIRHRRDPESGASVIEVMFNDANPPAYRITRMSDGTINVEPPGEHRAKFNFNATKPTARAIRQNKEIILRRLLELHPNPAAAIVQRDGNTQKISQARRITDPAEPFLAQAGKEDQAEHPAREMLDGNLRGQELPESPRTRAATIKSLPGLITRTVRKSLATTGATNFPGPRRRNQNGDRDTVHHNIIAANQAVMDQIPPSSQAAVRYFKNVVAPLCDRMVRFQSPGQMIKTVQRHLDMEPDLWKWFLRTGENIVYEENADRNRVAASLQARLLRDANRPHAHPLRISTVSVHLHNTRTIRFMPMDSNDPWNAWVRAVNLYLAPDGPPTYEENADLTHIGDAIRYQASLMEPQPWPTEPWTQMVERAERVVRRDRRTNPQNHLAWDSALGAVELDGFGFVPATTSAELFQWGQVMQNCLASYDTACAHEARRIFIAHSPDGKPVATVELEQREGIWQQRQLEGKGRTRVSKGLEAAAGRLAQQYERAARRKNAGTERAAG